MKQNLKVGIVLNSVEDGGANISIAQCLEQWKNVDIDIISPTQKIPELFPKIKNLRLQSLQTNLGCVHNYSGAPFCLHPSWFRSLLRIPKTAENLKKICCRKKYDIVILNSLVLWPYLFFLRKISKRSFLWIRETKAKKYFFTNFLCKMCFKYAKKIIFISEYDRALWRPEISKSVVIPNLFKDHIKNGIPNKATKRNFEFHYITFCGFTNFKGFYNLIKLAKLIPEKNFLLCGIPRSNKMKNGVLNKIKRRLIYKKHLVIKRINNIRPLFFNRNNVHYLETAEGCLILFNRQHQTRQIVESQNYGTMCFLPKFPCLENAPFKNENCFFYTPGDMQSLKSRILNSRSLTSKNNVKKTRVKLCNETDIILKQLSSLLNCK